MAEGLRDVGSCPRCGGALTFSRADPEAAPAVQPAADTAPHLVLGIPRR